MPTKTLRRLVATYEVYSLLTIPADLFLLPVEEEGDRGAGNWDEKEYGSWYVRWDTLHYIDKNLKEQTLDLHEERCDENRKLPEKVEFEDYTEHEDTDDEEEGDCDCGEEDCEKKAKPETDDFRRFLAIIHPADE
jgi:hypothetical protein